jgi:[pyruvate, phosphate dikinase]-phosphate phosphotransferase / [pyruvate, phosphate dikinase] kinase
VQAFAIPIATAHQHQHPTRTTTTAMLQQPTRLRSSSSRSSQQQRQQQPLAMSSSSSSSPLELSEDDEELIRLIRGPMGASIPRPRPKTVVIVSDTTGVTAKAAVEKSLAQFNGCDERYNTILRSSYLPDDTTNPEEDEEDEDEDCENLTTQIFPFVHSEDEIARIVRKASERQNALVVFTLSDPVLRERTARMCELSGLPYVDLLGPMFQAMVKFFDRQPAGANAFKRVPAARRVLSDHYYRRIEAVEYTLKCDDGMSPALLSQADVILLGVSRTGKTPLSVVLAQTMGLKVANIPLVVDLPPPAQLLQQPQRINPQRVFCLTLNADVLLQIRQTRIERELRQFSTPTKNTYADRTYLLADLQNARLIAAQYGFTEIDVTGRAVEETASLIRSLLYERFGDLV